MTSITFHGGVNDIGGNKFLVEDKGTKILMDFGMSFTDEGKFFSQFMNEHIESHNRATVLSSLSMIDSFFDVIIFISVGYLTNLSLSYSFIFSAIIMAIALIFFRITDEHIKAEI